MIFIVSCGILGQTDSLRKDLAESPGPQLVPRKWCAKEILDDFGTCIFLGGHFECLSEIKFATVHNKQAYILTWTHQSIVGFGLGPAKEESWSCCGTYLFAARHGWCNGPLPPGCLLGKTSDLSRNKNMWHLHTRKKQHIKSCLLDEQVSVFNPNMKRGWSPVKAYCGCFSWTPQPIYRSLSVCQKFGLSFQRHLASESQPFSDPFTVDRHFQTNWSLKTETSCCRVRLPKAVQG